MIEMMGLYSLMALVDLLLRQAEAYTSTVVTWPALSTEASSAYGREWGVQTERNPGIV